MAKAKRKTFTKSKKSTQAKRRIAKAKAKAYKKQWRKARRRARTRGSKVINVKEDKDGYSKSYKKTKVTRQEQRKINNRFKNGYSPFSKDITNQFQDTIYQEMDKCKWVWRCHNTFNDIVEYFGAFPATAYNSGANTQQATSNTYYFDAPDQEIYVSKMTRTYEILNPTDYDMNLVIYDVVCKYDTPYFVTNWNYNSTENGESTGTATWKNINFTDMCDPIHQIYKGLQKQNGIGYPFNNTQNTPDMTAPTSTNITFAVDANAKNIYNIQTNPTESYPFNIYWKIVKKHVFRLQPGATLKHKFVHRPKAMISRGYFGYKYGKQLNTAINTTTRNIGLQNITAGCLFKYWGQVSGKGDSSITMSTASGQTNNPASQDHTQVVQLSGRIMFKEYVELKWYAMNQKFSFKFIENKSLNSAATPTAYTTLAEESLEVVNDAKTKASDAMDIISTNN